MFVGVYDWWMLELRGFELGIMVFVYVEMDKMFVVFGIVIVFSFDGKGEEEGIVLLVFINSMMNIFQDFYQGDIFELFNVLVFDVVEKSIKELVLINMWFKYVWEWRNLELLLVLGILLFNNIFDMDGMFKFKKSFSLSLWRFFYKG